MLQSCVRSTLIAEASTSPFELHAHRHKSTFCTPALCSLARRPWSGLASEGEALTRAVMLVWLACCPEVPAPCSRRTLPPCAHRRPRDE
eukprot:scaffold34_cov271-Prasinococcus_capsulatus_cf.AAC.11